MKPIEGQVCKYSYDNNRYITKFHPKGNVKSIYLNSKALVDNNFSWSGELEEATKEEIAWYEKCIAANKFIPKEEVIFNTELNIEIW
jgi:hypothetical protein